MASETAEVVNRCDAAKSTSRLDLSHCKLTAVPQAVFFLLKGTALEEVDLSWNELKKLSPKVGSSEAFGSASSEFTARAVEGVGLEGAACELLCIARSTCPRDESHSRERNHVPGGGGVVEWGRGHRVHSWCWQDTSVGAQSNGVGSRKGGEREREGREGEESEGGGVGG